MQEKRLYYRYPTAAGDNVYMVSHETIWQWSKNNGLHRFLLLKGPASHLSASLDGKWLAFTSQEESHSDVYVVCLQSQQVKRLTYFSTSTFVTGWTKNNTILCASTYEQLKRIYCGYEIDPISGKISKLQYKYATRAVTENKIVVQVNGYGYNMWRNYKGGDAARLWYKNEEQNFKELPLPKNNAIRPVFCKNELYFLSDIDGIGNIYHYDLNTYKYKQCTTHENFYVRDLSVWNDNLLYSCGGNIYLYDTKTGKSNELQLHTSSYSPYAQNTLLEHPENYVTCITINNQGSAVGIAIRGHVFRVPLWNKSAWKYTTELRYRICTTVNDNEILAIRDMFDDASFEIYDTNVKEAKRFFLVKNIARIESFSLSEKEYFACINNRNELWIVDLKNELAKKVTQSKYGIKDLAWSHDGEWLAYVKQISSTISVICLYNFLTEKTHEVTEGRFKDTSPSFSLDGNYLYFLSFRHFNAEYDRMRFDLHFASGTSIYAVCLNNKARHPFHPWLYVEEDEEKEEDNEKNKEKSDNTKDETDENDNDANNKGSIDVNQKDANNKDNDAKTNTKLNEDKTSDDTTSNKNSNDDKKLNIEFDNIKLRIIEYQVKEKQYKNLWALNKKLLLVKIVENKYVLETLDLATMQIEVILQANSLHVQLSRNKKCMVILYDNILRIGKAGEKFNDNDTSFKNGGKISWNNFITFINPQNEWKQMLQEVWWLNKEHFWNKKFIESDWQVILDKYIALLPRIQSREELNILFEDMNGELQTSHAYVLERGDVHSIHHNSDGYLAAKWQWNNDGYEILKMYIGDSWNNNTRSPLLEQSANIKIGEKIVAIDGVNLSEQITPEQCLRNKGEESVGLLIQDLQGTFRTVHVKALSTWTNLVYRSWVNKNLEYTHKKSQNKIGYVHIPNMMSEGFSEFYRYYLHEHLYDGLIIDVRYNGGGHVSELILDQIQRKITGIFKNRFDIPEYYPSETPQGTMVLLTNEKCGSDGDIFSYMFKKLKLGTIIGKRTWGGVVGIAVRYSLIDGGITSQPEWALWTKDQKFNIENSGIEPDIEVNITPEDWENGKDPQLEKAIEILQEKIKNHVRFETLL